MSAPGLNAVSSLPVLSGDGIPSLDNVTNVNTQFNPTSTPTPYSNLVQNPSALVGTIQVPYQPVGLPNYISTLYQNVYNINTSLVNDISAAASDNRVYPTAFAVQNYVQSQISGTQLIGNATGQDTGNVVNTTVNNTIILDLMTTAMRYTYAYDDASGNPQTGTIYVLHMDNSPNAPRNGSSKQVILSARFDAGDLVYLYAGDGCSFLSAGEQFCYYQFSYPGAFIQFTCIYDEINANGWTWFVTNQSSVLSIPYTGQTVTPRPFPDVTPL